MSCSDDFIDPDDITEDDVLTFLMKELEPFVER